MEVDVVNIGVEHVPCEDGLDFVAEEGPEDLRKVWDIGICGGFTLCEMNEVPSFWRYTIFETHTIDVRRKPVCSRCTCDVP